MVVETETQVGQYRCWPEKSMKEKEEKLDNTIMKKVEPRTKAKSAHNVSAWMI